MRRYHLMIAAPMLLLGSTALGACDLVPGGIPGASCDQLKSGDFSSLEVSGGADVKGKVVAFLEGTFELDKLVVDMETNLIASCAKLGAGLDVPAAELEGKPDGGEGAKAVCGKVQARIDELIKANASAKLSISVGPPRCYADIDTMTKCFGECGAVIDNDDRRRESTASALRPDSTLEPLAERWSRADGSTSLRAPCERARFTPQRSQAPPGSLHSKQVSWSFVPHPEQGTPRRACRECQHGTLLPFGVASDELDTWCLHDPVRAQHVHGAEACLVGERDDRDALVELTVLRAHLGSGRRPALQRFHPHRAAGHGERPTGTRAGAPGLPHEAHDFGVEARFCGEVPAPGVGDLRVGPARPARRLDEDISGAGHSPEVVLGEVWHGTLEALNPLRGAGQRALAAGGHRVFAHGSALDLAVPLLDRDPTALIAADYRADGVVEGHISVDDAKGQAGARSK